MLQWEGSSSSISTQTNCRKPGLPLPSISTIRSVTRRWSSLFCSSLRAPLKVLTLTKGILVPFLVSDRGAAHDGDGLPGLVLKRRFRADDDHGAHLAFALLEIGHLHRAGEDIAGADLVEVLDVGAAVEDALEGDVEAGRLRAARRLRRVVDGGAEEAGGRDDAAVALAPGVLLVEEDGVGVADGAGELAAAEVVDLVGDGRGLAAEGGAELVGDEGSLVRAKAGSGKWFAAPSLVCCVSPIKGVGRGRSRQSWSFKTVGQPDRHVP